MYNENISPALSLTINRIILVNSAKIAQYATMSTKDPLKSPVFAILSKNEGRFKILFIEVYAKKIIKSNRSVDFRYFFKLAIVIKEYKICIYNTKVIYNYLYSVIDALKKIKNKKILYIYV